VTGRGTVLVNGQKKGVKENSSKKKEKNRGKRPKNDPKYMVKRNQF